MKAVFWQQPFNRDAEIVPLEIDPHKYSHIILCSPIWLQNISSPARTVINTMPLKGKQMHIVITCGGHFGESGQTKLKELVSSKGIDLIGLHVIKAGGKSEEELRELVKEPFMERSR